MAIEDPKASMSFGEKLTSIPKFWLYLILMITTTLALLPTVEIPRKPARHTIDLFAALMSLPPDSTVILQSDWTNSSRGESAGAMEALLRLLMRKNAKFVIMAVGDPSAPQVARDTLARINKERKEAGEPEYKKWTNYLELGYFPNAEGTGQAMANNLRTAWAGKKEASPDGLKDVFESPVLKGISRVEQIQMIVNIHASDTLNRLIERIGKRTKLASMCTGVMGPETLVYHTSGQVVGVSVGLDGVVQFETLMQRGIDPYDGVDQQEVEKLAHDPKNPVHAKGLPKIEGFKDMKNYARGMQYYLSLHSALLLIILAVVIGNVGTFLSKKKRSD